MPLSKITLGGGCFWCIENSFNRLKGVHSAISGYTGGQVENPTYKQVSVACIPETLGLNSGIPEARSIPEFKPKIE